ncbi:MAG TPA: hypothetical protein VHY91_14915 [Pirellulales bacterium]|jgi:hypothetical protein|nr:hypothetical protein [Pirellulales bacterium]
MVKKRNSQAHVAIVSAKGRFATLTPAIDRILSHLTVPTHKLTGTPGGVFQIQRAWVPVYHNQIALKLPDGSRLQSRGYLRTGLAPVLQHLLAVNQIPHGSLSAGLSDIGQPEYTWVGVRHRPDYEFLEFVGRSPGGLVLYEPGRVDPAQLVVQVALAFPRARIVVGTTLIAEAKDCANRLRQHFSQVQLRINNWEPYRTSRIVVSLYNKMGSGTVALEERDIFIATQADEVISEIGDMIYPRLERARLFGFLPWNAQIAPVDERELAAWFGLGRVVIPEHGCRIRDVEYAFLDNRFRESAEPSADHFELRRKHVWQGKVRNGRILEVARAIEQGDRGFLESNLPAVVPLLPTDRSPGVLITAHAEEHAENLLRNLPDWGGDADLEAGFCPHEQNSLSRPGRRFVSGRSVVDPSKITRQLLEGVDVLVRADGGTGLPLRIGQLIDPVEQRRRLLVVDFRDGGDPVLRRWSRYREDAYRQHEWYEAGVNRTAQQAKSWLKLGRSA